MMIIHLHVFYFKEVRTPNLSFSCQIKLDLTILIILGEKAKRYISSNKKY